MNSAVSTKSSTHGGNEENLFNELSTSKIRFSLIQINCKMLLTICQHLVDVGGDSSSAIL